MCPCCRAVNSIWLCAPCAYGLRIAIAREAGK